MCSIFASIGIPPTTETINAARLSDFRGIRAKTEVVGNDVILHHARLPTSGLSEESDQPLWNEDKTLCIMMNGNAYSHRAARKGLQKPHQFKGGSDAETILHLFEEKKSAAKVFNSCEGDYTAVIFDRRKKGFYIISDPLMYCPLYKWEEDRKIILASELKQIAAIIKPKINPWYDFESKVFGFPVLGTTPFGGIKKLQPCTKKIRRLPRDLFEASKSEILNQVMLKSRSDLDVVVAYSGGVDSFIIAAALKALCGGGKLIHIIMNKEESSYAEESAKLLGMEISSFVYFPHRSDINDAAWLWEGYNDLGGVMPEYFLYKTLSKRFKNHTVLTGMGGDEIFGGYRRNLETSAERVFSNHILKDALLRKFVKKRYFKSFNNGPRSLIWFSDVCRELPYYHFPKANKMGYGFRIDSRGIYYSKRFLDISASLTSNLVADMKAKMTKILLRKIGEDLSGIKLAQKKIPFTTPGIRGVNEEMKKAFYGRFRRMITSEE